jgi:glycosyltransferase involved in cell wall biosynthesis
MSDGPQILIFEPEATGHQIEYLRHILTSIDQSIGNSRIILLTTTYAANHPNYLRMADEFRHLVTTRLVPAVPGRNRLLAFLEQDYERQWRRAEQLHRGLIEIGVDNVDFVFVPHLESVGLLQLALRRSLFGGKPWATIAIAVRFHHRKCGIEGPVRPIDVVQNICFRRVIRDPALACFGTVNPYLSSFAASAKVRYCPEPCAQPMLSSPDKSRAAYGIRSDTFVVLVYGILDRRKCIGVLLEAAARVRDELDLTVFLAGPQQVEHLAPLLSGEAARKLRERDSLVEVNRFILNGKDIDPFGAADVSWVFYERNFVYNSGALVYSGLARRPVIVRRQGVVGRLVEDHNLGLALASEAPEIVASALHRLAGNPALRREMGENAVRAFAQNTPENFARPILDGIREALGRTPGPPREIAATG